MKLIIVDAQGNTIQSFTVAGADAAWLVRNAQELTNITRLYKGADMRFEFLK